MTMSEKDKPEAIPQPQKTVKELSVPELWAEIGKAYTRREAAMQQVNQENQIINELQNEVARKEQVK